MKSKVLKVFLSTLLFLSLYVGNVRSDVTASPSWTSSLLSGAWSWFNDPRAVYSTTYNKTYFGVIAAVSGTIWIANFDHSLNTLSFFNLHYNLEYDYHDSPSILIRTDGRLIVFYAKHSVENVIYYRISTNPGDISSFAAEQTINVGGTVTYTQVCFLSGEGKIYLFTRGPSVISWSYFTSIDNGETWSALQQLLTVGATNQYLLIASNGVDKIYFTHAGNPASEITSVYAFYYFNNNFYKSDGTLIGTPVPLGRSDMTLVYDASEGGHSTQWIEDITFVGGIPYIVFTTLDAWIPANYVCMYAKWDGGAWVHYEISPGGSISFDLGNPNVVYFTKLIGARWEIYKGVTPDGGASWNLSAITSNSVVDNHMPIVPINYHSDLFVLWLAGGLDTYTTYLSYVTSLLWW